MVRAGEATALFIERRDASTHPTMSPFLRARWHGATPSAVLEGKFSQKNVGRSLCRCVVFVWMVGIFEEIWRFSATITSDAGFLCVHQAQ